MQLNIHVPKNQEALVSALRERSRLTGMPANQIVLVALDKELGRTRRPFKVRTFNLGGAVFDRAEIYEEQVNHKLDQVDTS